MRKKSPPKKRQSRKRDTVAQHVHWLKRADEIAHKPVSAGGSPHPTVQVGAVIVDKRGREAASAANRFPHGVDRRRPERYKSGSKSLWINCAEQLAMADALKKRADIKGATMYITLEPCATCAGLIAELGIRHVCVPVGAMRRYARLKAKWKDSIEIGAIKLAEAGVTVTSVDVP